MLGSLIGGAVSAAGHIFGDIKASEAMKKVKSSLEGQRQANQAWYDRRYNEDATQRADAQRILTQTQEMIKNRNRQAAGAQAVAGGTEESVAAAKAAGNQVLAEAASRIAVAGDARKDQVEAQYQSRDAQLRGKLDDMEVGKAQQLAAAVPGVAQAGAGLADAIETGLTKNTQGGN